MFLVIFHPEGGQDGRRPHRNCRDAGRARRGASRRSALLALLAALSPAAASAGTLDLTARNAENGIIHVPNTNGGPVSVVSNDRDAVAMWYQKGWAGISVHKDGSVTVREVHATGQATTLRAVKRLYFVGGTGVALPSLKPITLIPPTASTAGAILAPDLPQPQRADDIVAVELRNHGETPLAGGIVTFGQAFVQGDLPRGAALAADSAAGALPVALSVQTRHPDGSVRHALISLRAPALAPRSALDVILRRSSRPLAGAGPSPADILASGYDITLVLNYAGSTPVAISAAATLQEAVVKGTVETWFRNPLAAEYRVAAPLNRYQQAIFDIRAQADGSVMTDVIVTNDFAYLPPQSFAYDALVLDHGTIVWQAANLTHSTFQDWHHTVWSGTRDEADIVFDVPYLIRSGAVPPLDLSLGISNDTLKANLEALAAAPIGPLGTAMVMPFMPLTGGRDDIGIVPNWTANWLVSQDPRARRIMLANADAAGSVPWHLRETDGAMVTAARHPQLWLDSRCTQDCLPTGFELDNTGWTLDIAHEPDLTYVPYLVTGLHFYLDQLEHEANWELLSGNPAYRGGAKGLVYPTNQIRGVAWNIRDISNAGWMTPDEHPLKRYFDERARWNVENLYDRQVRRHIGPKVGEIEGFLYDVYHPDNVAPWEQDFVVLALSQQATRHYLEPEPFEEYMANFVAGRFLHGAEGYDPLHGPAYWPGFVHPSTDRPVTSWRAFYNVNYAGQPAPTVLDGYPTANDGYAVVARAATAELFSTTGSLDALRAFAYLVSQTRHIYPQLQQGAYYDLYPILPDGHVLQTMEIQYGERSGRLEATNRHNLLIGGDGRTTLKGAFPKDRDGISILYAGTGPTTLIAGLGTSYLFGGAAHTTMVGAPGTNFLSVGTGPAEIRLNASDAAVDRIDRFRPGTDFIHVEGLSGTVAALIRQAVSDGKGGSALPLGPSHKLLLTDLPPGKLSPAMFD